MKTAERLTKIEMEIKIMKKLLWAVLLIAGGHVGIEYTPIVTALLG